MKASRPANRSCAHLPALLVAYDACVLSIKDPGFIDGHKDRVSEEEDWQWSE